MIEQVSPTSIPMLSNPTSIPMLSNPTSIPMLSKLARRFMMTF